MKAATVLTLLQSNNVLPLWRKTGSLPLTPENFWAKIAATWYLLYHPSRSLRLVEGRDHWWVEWDLMDAVFLFDWNAFSYQEKRQQEVSPHILRPGRRNGEILLVFDRLKKEKWFWEQELYGIKHYRSPEKEQQLQEASASWIKKTGLTAIQYQTLRSLAESYWPWQK